MPNVKGRVRKGKTKSKVDDEEKVPEEVEAGMEMAEPDGAEDIEGKDDDAENNDDNAWQTKAELEALEAEINAESLVLTRAKSSREPPSSLILPLLPYQKEFLSWAIEQETGLVRGGILADEMGLGKTLQAVSLIVTHPREGQILGPDDGVVMPSSVKTVPAPSMKLKLPSHMAARGNIEQCKSLRSATDDGEPLGAAVPATSKPHSAATAECLKQDVDMNDDEPSAVASDTPQKTSPTETTQAQQPAASTSKAMQGIEEDTEAACTTPKPEPPKGKAVGKKGKSTKKSKGKASATEAPATEASPASAQVPPDAETAEGDAATPASGSGDPAKTKKSPKSKVKKPRVDPMLAAMEQAKTCRVEDEDGGDQPFCNTTLVVSPVVAAMQWRQEILRYMAPGSINVLLYHGTNRADTFTRKQLEAADIVLTTYSILEVDYRRNVMAPKATCSFCGKKFQPERLKVHLRYFCGPWAEKTEAQARQEKKRAPWMMRGGGSKGKGGKQDGKDKGKGSAGASTSAAAQAEAEGAEAEAAEAAMDEDEATEEDTEMQVLPDGRSPKMKTKSRARLATGKASAKNKAAAATAKGKGGGKKAKEAAAGTSAAAGKKAKARKPPAKKQKTAVAQDVSDAPSASGTDDDDDSPLAVPVLLPQQTGKVTRSRSASLAAATAAPEPDSDFMDATDTEPTPPTRKTRAKAAAKPPPKVGAKRKRTAAKKPAPKRGRAPAKRGGGSGSDGSETDWAPESEDEQQAEMDAVVSDSDLSDEAAVLSDGGESEVEVGEEEEDDDVVVVDDAEDAGRPKGKGKGKGKGKKGEVDEEELQLEREVEAAANKMIAKAQKERDQQVQGKSLLHQIRWRRIVLDEAHCIKDRRCNTAQSAFALQARYRWCLTGTPLQNRVNELYSLIRFLRLHPFSHYFADKTKCCSLDFPFKNDLRRCDLCGGSRMSHYCWWNRRIANPIKYNGYEGRGRTAMLILKHQILPVVLLRRTKLMCAADLALPPRTVILRKDPFDRQEEDFYEALYTQSQAAFGGYVESGTLLNNYAHIFDLLIRLRQAVNHPYLVVYSATGGRNDSLAALPGAPDASAVVEEATTDDASQPLLGVCGICHDPLEDGIPAACGHSFCRVCVTEYLDNSVGATACPSCQRPLTIDLTAPSTTAAAAAADAAGSPGGGANGATAEKFKKRSIMNRINTRAFQSSTKLEALNEAIQRMLAADPSAKCIVFSQFTSMLDLAQYRLQQTGVRCVRLEGSMTLIMRNRMIQSFNEEPGVTCFLMSLKAGGVALNLTVASHVMLMDPWWNPAVEQQAQDRIHRLGQYKPITVTRFVIAGTIEERILKLQEKKRLVFEGTVGRDAEALGKLTVDDLRFLFG